MIINAIVFLIVCECVSVVLNSWTARRQPVWLTWKIIWFPVKFYLLSFCFTLESKLFAIIIVIMCVSVSPAIYIWSTIAFTATVLIVWLCWLRFLSDDHVFFYQFRAQFQNSTTTKIKVPFHLRFSAYELLSLLKFLLLYVLMEFMCYMLLTINWCVFFSSGTNFNFFSVDFLTMDLCFSTFHLTFHSMI